MKSRKILAVLLTAVISFSAVGCEGTNEALPKDNEETVEISVAAEITSAEITSAEIESAETASSEKRAETETSAVKAPEQDDNRLEGEWTVINDTVFDGNGFSFDSEGNVTILGWSGDISGTYTYDNGLLEMTLPYEDEDYILSWAAVFWNGILLLQEQGLNTELIREEFVPYEDGMTPREYFRDVCGREYAIDPVLYLISADKNPVPAQQNDIIGVWLDKENIGEEDEKEGLILFEDDRIITLADGEIWIVPGIMSDGVIEDSEVFTVCAGDRLYVMNEDNEYAPAVCGRYENVPLTADMLNGYYISDASEEFTHFCYFKDGKFYTLNDEGGSDASPFTTEDDKITLPLDGTDVTFTYYYSDNYIYLLNGQINAVFKRDADNTVLNLLNE